MNFIINFFVVLISGPFRSLLIYPKFRKYGMLLNYIYLFLVLAGLSLFISFTCVFFLELFKIISPAIGKVYLCTFILVTFYSILFLHWKIKLCVNLPERCVNTLLLFKYIKVRHSFPDIVLKAFLIPFVFYFPIYFVFYYLGIPDKYLLIAVIFSLIVSYCWIVSSQNKGIDRSVVKFQLSLIYTLISTWLLSFKFSNLASNNIPELISPVISASLFIIEILKSARSVFLMFEKQYKTEIAQFWRDVDEKYNFSIIPLFIQNLPELMRSFVRDFREGWKKKPKTTALIVLLIFLCIAAPGLVVIYGPNLQKTLYYLMNQVEIALFSIFASKELGVKIFLTLVLSGILIIIMSKTLRNLKKILSNTESLLITILRILVISLIIILIWQVSYYLIAGLGLAVILCYVRLFIIEKRKNKNKKISQIFLDDLE